MKNEGPSWWGSVECVSYGWWVRSPFRAHAWVGGQILSWGLERQRMDASLPLSLPPPLSNST